MGHLRVLFVVIPATAAIQLLRCAQKLYPGLRRNDEALGMRRLQAPDANVKRDVLCGSSLVPRERDLHHSRGARAVLQCMS
jgi:hypothetical protein